MYRTNIKTKIIRAKYQLNPIIYSLYIETYVMVSIVWFNQIVEFIQSVEFSTPQQYNSACIKSNPSNIGGEIAKININIDFHDPNG